MPAAALAVRVSAQIAEFQKAFADAQRTTRGFEKDFAGMASSVQAHQDRLNRTFAQFAGDKIIGDANAVVTAIAKVGGASKLTESEMVRVNSTLTEAIAKYKALGQTAPPAMLALEAATRKAEAAIAPLPKALDAVQQKASLGSQAVGLLSGAFATFTAANLAANLIATVTGKLAEFVVQGQKLAPVEASFKRLTASVGQDSRAMLASLQTATQGMVSNYDLMLSANKAVLLGLPVTAKEMGDLAKTATVLGKAMGIDATQSLNDLITALGRSSPLILDNLGLTVSVAEANAKYAATLGKTAEQLTDAEKKMAFYTEAMEKARAKQKELGDQSKTLSEIMATVWTKIGNVVSTSASFWDKALGNVLSSMQNLDRFAHEVTMFGFAEAMQRAKDRSESAAAAIANLGKATAGAVVPQRNFAKELEHAAKTMPVLTIEGKKQYEAAVRLGTKTEELTKLFGLSALQQELYAEQQRKAKEATEQLTAAQKKADTAMGQIVQRAREREKQEFATQQAMHKTVQALQVYVVAHRGAQAVLTDFLTNVDALTPAWKRLNDQLKASTKVVGTDFAQAQTRATAVIAEARHQLELQERALGDLGRALIGLGQVAGGGFGALVSGAGGVITAFDQMGQAAKEFGQITNATFAQTAAFAIGQFTSILGIMQQAISFLERDELRGQRRTFLADQGGLQNFQTRATTAGVGTGLLLATRSASTFNAEMERVNRRIKEAEDRLARYGLTWRDLGQTVRQANIDQITRELLKDWKQLGLQGVDATKAMAGGLSQLVIDAKKTGTKIPAALAPMLRTLIESKQLSEDAARALLGMAEDATPAFKDVEDAAHRYGIELDALGPKVAQLRITDIAKQLVKDFDLFQKSGADMNQVLLGMQKAVQDVVTEALTLGLEIPESMRPLLEAMAKAGLLTDETGAKMTDLSRLNFAKPITDAIEALIAKLDELIDKWSAVGTAADDAGGRQRGALPSEGQAVPRGTTPPAGTTPPEPGAPEGGPTGTRSLTVNTYLDGRTIAQRTVPYLPDVLDVHGV